MDGRCKFEQRDVVIEVTQVKSLVQNHPFNAVADSAVLKPREVMGARVDQPVASHGVPARRTRGLARFSMACVCV